MRNLAILIFISSYSLQAQDSLKKTAYTLFDFSAYGSFGFYQSNKTDLESMSRFTSDKSFINESSGYSSLSYSEEEPSGMDFGLNASFKINNPRHKFFKRVKPRIYIHGTELYFSHSMGFSSTDVKDSLFYTDPKVKPLIIDSASFGRLTYRYSSRQVMLEIGASVDVFTFNYFNFYTGIVLGQGISVQNQFSLSKHESYRIDKYPNQKEDKFGVIKDYEVEENSPMSYTSRVSFPIGVQHRFRNRHNFSLGIFCEFRPGFEFYSVKNGPKITRYMLLISGGLRFSLTKHKS